MSRTLLIGLDGAPFTLLDSLIEQGVMPFLGEFAGRCARANLRSTPHPLTPPAWTSIITGRSPANHGIFDFIWAEQRDTQHYFTLHNFRDIRVETVWSIAGRQHRTATTLNFPLMAPPPRIRGHVVPGFVSWKYLRLNVHPRELWDELKRIPDFNVKQVAWDFEQEKKAEQGVPADEYEAWVEFHIARERQWFEIARYLMRERPSDLTAVLFDGVDKILHMGYRFVDPRCFPEPSTEHDRRIRGKCLEYFATLDGFLRELVELHGDAGRVFIVSDHGFGPSSFVFRCNTWLAEQGYLFWQDLDSLDGAARRGAEKVADGHFVLLDWDRTTAYARTVTSNGIFITVAERPGAPGVPPASYAAFREELVRRLLDIRHPETNQPIVKDVLLKDEVFAGPHNAQAPDLTLVMSDHGFISVKNKQPIVLVRPLVEGTHYPDGVFLASGPGIRRGTRLSDLSVVDVTPCVLHSLGLPIPSDLEGRVSEEMFERSFLASRLVAVGPPTLEPEEGERALEDSGLLEDDGAEAIFQQMKSLGYME
jgi:predicted AlkP superfamily phosphohydrolase/phosphomutase